MKLLTILGVIISLMPGFVFAQHVIDDSENSSYLLVMSAASGSFEGDTLTLNGVPNVIYFSNHPARIAGHSSLQEFLGSWDQGNDRFSEDPPNAVLSILNKNGTQNIVVELMNVESKDSSLNFKVKELKGDIPKEFEAAALFIDDHHIKTPGVF